MNNLCCLLNPQFICHACSMKACHACYETISSIPGTRVGSGNNPNEKYKYIMFHEKFKACPQGADSWTSHDGYIIYSRR